jgi:hypothetical protein
LVNTLRTCFSTALWLISSCSTIAELEWPWAISESTSRSRAVSASTGRWTRPISCDTTSGSMTVPPAATRAAAATNSCASATRSLSR